MADEIRKIISREFRYATKRGWYAPRGATRQTRRRTTARYKKWFFSEYQVGPMSPDQLARYIYEMHAPDWEAW